MPTISSSKTYVVGLGTPLSTTLGVTFLGLASQGTPGAERVLTHPDQQLAPIVYDRNPDDLFNFHNTALRGPISFADLTLSSTVVTRFDTLEEDTIVTEQWLGARGTRGAMATFFYIQLYEYLINPPAFDPINPSYIQWEPRDRSDEVWNVQLLDLRSGGGGSRDRQHKVRDLRAAGGSVIENATAGLNVLPTGIIDETVQLLMRLVSKV